MKKISNILYYGFILLLILGCDRLMSSLNKEEINQSTLTLLEEENLNLKEKVEELSGLEGLDATYFLGEIIVKNLYLSNTYYVKTNKEMEKGDYVVSKEGLVGVLDSDSSLIFTSDLDLSVSINYHVCEYKKKIVSCNDEINVGDKVETSYLSYIPEHLYVGEVESVEFTNNKYIGHVKNVSYDVNYVWIGKSL